MKRHNFESVEKEPHSQRLKWDNSDVIDIVVPNVGGPASTTESVSNAIIDECIPNFSQTPMINVAKSRSESNQHILTIPEYKPPNKPLKDTSGKKSGRWQDVLFPYIKPVIPSMLLPAVYLQTDSYIVIYDGYPKARVHLLILSKVPFHPPAHSIYELCTASVSCADDFDNHLSSNVNSNNHALIIKNMHHIGNTLIQSDALRSAAKGAQLLIGYHAHPSLQPLHVHIISDDFDSPALKTQKHWNSFNTNFFVPAEVVENNLFRCTQNMSSTIATADGSNIINSFDEQKSTISTLQPLPNKDTVDSLLDLPLRCHCCRKEYRYLPQLKEHIKACRKLKLV